MIQLIDLDQLEFIHPTLRDVMNYTGEQFGPMTWTSLYRIGDSGVHGQLKLRGADARCRIQQVGKAIERAVNREWLYDFSRPYMAVCIYHGHLHFQVHSNTRRV